MTRSRPHDASSLTDAALGGVAEVWKRSKRELEASFDGVSMRPTIEPLQSVTVRCGLDPRLGDVVLALRNGTVIVHRVVLLRRDWLVTRGDNRSIPDLPMNRDDVVGIVDVAAYAPRGKQRFVLAFFRAAALFGRRAAHACVRLLQLASKVT